MSWFSFTSGAAQRDYEYLLFELDIRSRLETDKFSPALDLL